MAGVFSRYWQRWISQRIPPSRQVRLNQKRIFIIPTAQGAMFGVLLILLLLVAINYQNSLAYGLAFLLLSVFVVAILHTWRNLAGLQLAAGELPNVFAGEQACFRVRLQSEQRAYHAIAIGWPEQGMQQVDIEAGGLSTAELFLPASRRGWLQAPRMRVETRFPLGLLVAWSRVDLDLRALVYPQPLQGSLPASHGAADPDEQQEGQARRRGGVDDFQGLREWQPGDSLRRMSWKAFSRGQGLQVKDFAELAGHDLWLDFDLLGGDSEMRLSILCWWVLELARGQDAFGLRLPGVEVGLGTGALQRDRCLRALALHGIGERAA